MGLELQTLFVYFSLRLSIILLLPTDAVSLNDCDC